MVEYIFFVVGNTHHRKDDLLMSWNAGLVSKTQISWKILTVTFLVSEKTSHLLDHEIVCLLDCLLMYIMAYGATSH